VRCGNDSRQPYAAAFAAAAHACAAYRRPIKKVAGFSLSNFVELGGSLLERSRDARRNPPPIPLVRLAAHRELRQRVHRHQVFVVLFPRDSITTARRLGGQSSLLNNARFGALTNFLPFPLSSTAQH
jgi:hypothetical protein